MKKTLNNKAMDDRFNLKAIWQDEVKRKKIIAIVIIIIASIIFLRFYYGGDSEDEQKKLSEIPMTEAEEVRDYNSKLDAVNDTIKKVNYFNDELNTFFSTDDKTDDKYADEERKADSLSRIFAKSNSSYQSSNENSSRQKPNIKVQSNDDKVYDSQSNSYVEPQNSAVVNNIYEQVKTKEQILDEKRQSLLGNNNNNNNRISNSNSLKAVIRGTQSKKNNEDLVLKTLEEIYISNVTIPKNTYLYARLQFSNGRAMASVKSVNVKGKIIPVDFDLYGLDGNRGIPIQNTNFDKAGSTLTNEAENVVNSTGTVGRILTSVSGTLRGSKDVQITFIDNQAVILYTK